MIDVAQAAGVSASTVERVLSGRHPVRQETAGKVLKAAEKIGFYGTKIIRDRLRVDVPQRKFGFVLQQVTMPFHQALGERLKSATSSCRSVRATARVDFSEDLSPQVTAERLERLGQSCHAVAVVSADHPAINAAVDRLSAGYVGVNNRVMGRTAAWLTTKIARSGEMGIFVGGHRYLCQEQREIGFRSFVREHCPEVDVLEPYVTHEDERIAHEATEGLLKRHPRLSGLFVAGGGVRGVVRALQDNPRSEELCVVCVERTPETEAALLNGVVSAILAHPLQRLADSLVAAMIERTANSTSDQTSTVLEFEIYTPENVLAHG
jgi:LacI family transcriptional regulator